MMYFSSENFDAAHPATAKALLKANKGFVPSYGNDDYTVEAINDFKKAFGTNDIEVFFCFNGTGANNFALSAITGKHSAILCSDVSHLYTAESTAPEAFTGCRLYPLQAVHGKIVIDNLVQKVKIKNDMHRPPATVLTITQPTEYGTIYNAEELKMIATHCKANNILLHIDGARLFNALAAMECSLKEFVKISGADVLTLGGTKAGMMFGEAVIFFNSKRFSNLKYGHKRSMQLASKNRFIAVQFSAMLKNALWEKIAQRTNGLAKYFEHALHKTGGCTFTHPVQTNMVFMKMDKDDCEKLHSAVHFYRWDEQQDEVRFAFSFGNTKSDVEMLVKKYRQLLV